MPLFRGNRSIWPADGSDVSLDVPKKHASRSQSARFFPTRMSRVCSRSRRLVILALFPTIALIVCVTLSLQAAATQSRTINQVKHLVSSSLEQVGDLVHRLQIERGTTVLYLSSNRDPDVLSNLISAYKDTDAEMKNITNWRQIDITDPENVQYSYFETKETLQEHISEYRQNISLDREGLREPLPFYSEIVERIIEWFWQDFSSYQNGDEWPSLVAYQLVILAKEQLGVERALGGRFFALGGYERIDEYLDYMNRSIKGNAYLEEAHLFSDVFKDFYITNILQSDLYSRIAKMRSEIYLNNFTNIDPDVIRAAEWFEEMTNFINLLLQVQYTLTYTINEDLENSISYRTKEVVFAILLLSVSMVLSPLILYNIAHQARQIENIADKLSRQAIQLNQEKARANKLLYQMLPCEIAESLKSSWDVAAEAFEQATIFFSDVVNFTSLCAECAPMQVVAMLNALYQTLDTRIELYDVYKVETIGDAYVVVSGVPRRNGDRHVYEMSCLAIDIRDTVGKLPIPHIPNECFQLRIGLHTGGKQINTGKHIRYLYCWPLTQTRRSLETGAYVYESTYFPGQSRFLDYFSPSNCYLGECPCAAGVVGHKMPRYCLFGDSVNTAARMESTGKPSKIHISSSTFTALKNYEEIFITEPRGTIYVKGKGRMETYWLVGKDQCVSHHGSVIGADEPLFQTLDRSHAIDTAHIDIPEQLRAVTS